MDKLTVNEKAKNCTHLSNINTDPLLNSYLKYLIEFKDKKTKLNVGQSEKADINIHGLGIAEAHVEITLEKGDYYINPSIGARTLRNGKSVDEKTKLNNCDRLVFGASSYYLFVDPSKFGTDFELMNEQINSFTAEKVQKEIAEETGLFSQYQF